MGQTVLLVVKAEFGREPGGNDRFTLFVNPVPGPTEPATGVIKSNSNIGMINRLSLASSGAHSLDELRIGTSFGEVTTVPEDVVYETFDYPEGSVQNLGGGNGFAEYWHVGGFNARQDANFSISAIGLQAPGLRVQGGSFKATATPSASALSGMTRSLASPIGEPGHPLLEFPCASGRHAWRRSQWGMVRVGFGIPAEPQLFIGKVSDGVGKYVMEDRGGANQVVSLAVPAVNETVFMVVKAEFAASGNDRFTLYVNPTPGQPEPASGLVKENSNIGLVSGLTLYSSGAWSMDEIHLGPSFADVTPAKESSVSPLQSWRQTQFGNGANIGNGADNADPDNDGVENLLEYAFAQLPNSPASRALPEWQTEAGSLVLSFTQPAGVTGITYTAEWNESLSSVGWIPVANTATPPAYRFSVPLNQDQSGYLRLRVSSP